MDQAEPEDQIIPRDQQKHRYDPNLGGISCFLLLKYINYQTKNAHSLLTLCSLSREMLLERKNLIGIFTLKPERLFAVQDALTHRGVAV